MPIEIVWGTGEGETPLSAFDDALRAGGIHNYNLVELSSVIPPEATLVEAGTHDQEYDVGEIVAAVVAENRSAVAGETVAAGLGWASAVEGGVFYEAHAEDARTVDRLLRRGVRDAREQREDWSWESDTQTRVVEHTVEENGAAVVAALYRPV